MRAMTITLLLASICATTQIVAAAELPSERPRAYPPEMPSAEVVTYKKVDAVDLKMYVYRHKTTQAPRPAIIFFFGGGWTSGSPEQFRYQCEYLASRGVTAISADYRVKSRHNTTAIDCVRDAADAIRYVRANASRLGVDADRIVAAGGSAGGHLAACLGTLAKIPGDAGPNGDVDFRPNAMILFNPALNLGDGAGQKLTTERTGVDPLEISPFHHVDDKTPPTLLLFGTDDKMVPAAQAFVKKMDQTGGRCEMELYPGEGHGFFNLGRDENKMFRATLERTDKFLESLGYVTGSPQVAEFFRN